MNDTSNPNVLENTLTSNSFPHIPDGFSGIEVKYTKTENNTENPIINIEELKLELKNYIKLEISEFSKMLESYKLITSLLIFGVSLLILIMLLFSYIAIYSIIKSEVVSFWIISTAWTSCAVPPLFEVYSEGKLIIKSIYEKKH